MRLSANKIEDEFFKFFSHFENEAPLGKLICTPKVRQTFGVHIIAVRGVNFSLYKFLTLKRGECGRLPQNGRSARREFTNGKRARAGCSFADKMPCYTRFARNKRLVL